MALESGGAETAAPWIERAQPTYPCLIDRQHVVAELFGFINVPMAVWIDEAGMVVRGPEAGGTTDMFRHMDRQTGAMPADKQDILRSVRRRYMAMLRDWAARGTASPSIARATVDVPSPAHYQAQVRFNLGQYLYRNGKKDEAMQFLREARELEPESWSIFRQTLALDGPDNAGSAAFWGAVDALGDERYYPDLDLSPAEEIPQ